jgi:hypothetical protein
LYSNASLWHNEDGGGKGETFEIKREQEKQELFPNFPVICP